MPDIEKDVELEGEYSTWTYQGIVSGDSNAIYTTFMIDNRGYLFVNTTIPNTKIYDKTGTLIDTINLSYSFDSYRQAYSLLTTQTGKYILGKETTDTDGQTFIVSNYNGTMTFTRSVVLDFASAYGGIDTVSISPNGKYVVIWVRGPTSATRNLLIYEGS